LTALARGTDPPLDDLAALNEAVAEAMVHARLLPGDEGFAWSWSAGEGGLDRIVWPVV
jgi:hypothetical protein